MAKESGGKVHSVSRAGASGPLQFMPATGTRFGLYRDVRPASIRGSIPQQAARANAAYINERFATLNRNLEYTVAAYNGGEGRAARLYAGNSGASFWSPQVYAQLPPETRDYVPAVIAAAWLFLHPKQYGLEFPKVDTTPGHVHPGPRGFHQRVDHLPGQWRQPRWLVPRAAQPQSALRATGIHSRRHRAARAEAGGGPVPRSIACRVRAPTLAQQLIRANKLYVPVAVARR